MSSTAFSLENRPDSSCTQTVQVPVWYGADYNTCSMQITTAPCFVSFPTTSCHTARPVPSPESSHGMSEFTKLWIVVGLTILLTIVIPVVVLWSRWKLSAPSRGGKRSISLQLERGTAKRSPKPPFSEPSGRSKKEPKSPNPSQNPPGRIILGRNRGSPPTTQGSFPSYPLIIATPFKPPAYHTSI